MKETLHVNLLDYVSVERAILKMYKFVDKCVDKTDKAMDDIAFGLRDMADSGYQSNAENENKDVSVVVEDKSGRYILRKFVRASGPDLMFNEFGAGSATDTSHEWAKIAGDVYPGSWSEQHGTGEYYKSRYVWKTTPEGFWHHNKIRYTKQEPSRALLNATDHYKKESQKILDKEFK